LSRPGLGVGCCPAAARLRLPNNFHLRRFRRFATAGHCVSSWGRPHALLAEASVGDLYIPLRRRILRGMATTVKESFRQYASNLNITDRQTTIVTNCKNNMVAKLGAELNLHDEKARVIGSWDRDTLTRYLSEGDVDVMVVLHFQKNEHWHTSDGTAKALARFKAILDKAYPDTPCRVDRNCVTMKLSQFRLDVVPAFRFTDGSYKIPDTHQKRWISTNPLAFAAAITAVNKTMAGTFVPLIKMMKGWNREVGWPIRSFHLECLLYNHYRTYTQSYTYSSTLNAFFSKLPGYVRKACYDPITGERVDGYLDNAALVSDRSKAIAKAEKAVALARKAYEDEEKYPSVAIGEWKYLFGEFFPAYG